MAVEPSCQTMPESNEHGESLGGEEESAGTGGSVNLDPADVFSKLGNATRLEIVNTLHEQRGGQPCQFSNLYDAVDLDDSAQFNYHLKKLVPHVVSKADDGYELTSTGRRIARAVAGGTYTHNPDIEPVEIDGVCVSCGESGLWASYKNELLSITCDHCEETIISVRVPPTIIRGREPVAAVDAFDTWARIQGQQAQNGLCPDCGGVVEGNVIEPDSETIQYDTVASFDCTVCGRQIMTSFGSIASRDPVVEEFLHRRGESLHDCRYWEIDQYVADDTVAVISRDPWRVRVSFYADGDACHVEIDDQLEIVKSEIHIDEGAENFRERTESQ